MSSFPGKPRRVPSSGSPASSERESAPKRSPDWSEPAEPVANEQADVEREAVAVEPGPDAAEVDPRLEH